MWEKTTRQNIDNSKIPNLTNGNSLSSKLFLKNITM